jgi:hypothetical protein
VAGHGLDVLAHVFALPDQSAEVGLLEIGKGVLGFAHRLDGCCELLVDYARAGRHQHLMRLQQWQRICRHVDV